MKLSEAIRLGAMLTPQAFDSYLKSDGTCAIGAAINAGWGELQYDDDGGEMVWYPDEFDALIAIKTVCLEGECAFRARNLHDHVTHLNDNHRWTRERIADWVEAIEATMEAPAELHREEVAK